MIARTIQLPYPARAFLGVLLLLLLAAPSAMAQPAYGGILRVALSSQPNSLDSRTNAATGGIVTFDQVQEGLLRWDPESSVLEPALAESWSVSEDGQTYTFNLRHGVRFHDGSDFSATDVVFTFDFITGARPGGDYVSVYAPMIASYEAADDYTFVVHLVAPWDDFLTAVQRAWVFKILSQKAVEAAGADYGVTTMMGTGPYRFVEWVRGDHLLLERNPDYWDAPLPYIDAIEYRYIADDSVRMVNLLAGEVDVVFDPPADQIKGNTEARGFRVIAASGEGMFSVQFNTRVAPFNDQRLRQALFKAIDREAIVQALFGGRADVPYDWLPAWWKYHDPSNPGMTYDPDGAKELLAEAGYGPSNPLNFELLITPSTIYQEVATVLQGMWAEVGINAVIRTLESTTREAMIRGRDGQNQDEFKAALFSQGLGSMTDDHVQKFYSVNGTLNRMGVNQPGGFTNDELEGLLVAARTASTNDEARVLFRKVIAIVEDAVPLIPLLNQQNVVAVANHVHDYPASPSSIFPYARIWLSPEGGAR